MTRRISSVAILVLLVSASLGAHDFWLAADPAQPAAGAPVLFKADSGDHYPKGTSYTAPERVDQWRLIGPEGNVPVAKAFRREGDALATSVNLPAAGAYLGVMTIVARTAKMKGPSFTDYLKEEGLTQIIASRQAAGEADKEVQERYSRYAKVAIRSGAGSGAHLTRPVGLKAEFVPITDPTSIKAGQPLTVQLLADGKPVADATITAVSTTEGVPVTGRTDANGHVTLKIDRAGGWLVKTVHMVKGPTAEIDWESFWVTLVFHTAT